MSSKIESVFDNADTVVRYLYSLKPSISPLKLQKSLYFLFAYYGAIYGKKEEEFVTEGVAGSPKYLFNAQFEAWKYGPVVREVYANHKFNAEYYKNKKAIDDAVEEMKKHPETKRFIDDLFSQINQVSDFGLVDRSHLDKSWSMAYKEDRDMNIEHIVEEYAQKYVG